MSNGNEVWARRFKKIRTEQKLSQKQLGIQAGLDPFVASPRLNRYELGIHKADYQLTQKLSGILNVPTAYFYTEDDELAEIMLIYHRAPLARKKELLAAARTLDETL